MKPWLVLLLGLVVLLFSAWLTGLLRHYALRTQLLDLPNERSSHTQPTPRGGGLALVVSFVFGLVCLWLWGGVAAEVLVAVGVGGVLIAAIGYLDDRHGLPARWRFLVHMLAASWALWWLGGFPALPVFDVELRLGWLGIPIGVVAIVWLLNLYNFMDGIDGIAATEAVTVAVGAALLLWLQGDAGAAALLVILAAAALGFLVWNWPPAKIFMGDVGSAFLGYVFAVLALGLSSGALNLWVWLILLGVFVVDATYTLLRRLLRGERVYQAHRSHAYQRAARRWGSHKKVTVATAGINVFWLLPLAGVAAAYPDWGVVVLAVAWLPLLGVAVALGAGVSNE